MTVYPFALSFLKFCVRSIDCKLRLSTKRASTDINEGEGSAAKVINDGRLYENLLDSSKELQMALEQLKILAADAREKGIKLKF